MDSIVVKKALLAEFIGTFFLVFFGTGSVIVNSLYPESIGAFGIAASFGLVVMFMIYTVGDISGAHFNPAVSIGFWVAGRLKGSIAFYYSVSQITAAITASFVLGMLFPNAPTMGETIPSSTVFQSFTLEIILTFILMFVIINVATGSKEQGLMAGLAIGFTVLICALVGGPISGASMNPARTIGPAIISSWFSHIWIYITAPIIGSVLSIMVWKVLKGKELNVKNND